MKIVLTFNEVEQMKKIMETVEAGSSKELIKSLQNNKIISCDVNIRKQRVYVTINENYMTEFLNVYGKYVGILMVQMKSITATTKSFIYDIDKVADKYSKGGEKHA